MFVRSACLSNLVLQATLLIMPTGTRGYPVQRDSLEESDAGTESDDRFQIILAVVCTVLSIALCIGVVMFLRRVVGEERETGLATQPSALSASISARSVDEAVQHRLPLWDSAGPGFGFDGLNKEEWQNARLKGESAGYRAVERPEKAKLKE